METTAAAAGRAADLQLAPAGFEFEFEFEFEFGKQEEISCFFLLACSLELHSCLKLMMIFVGVVQCATNELQLWNKMLVFFLGPLRTTTTTRNS